MQQHPELQKYFSNDADHNEMGNLTRSPEVPIELQIALKKLFNCCTAPNRCMCLFFLDFKPSFVKHYGYLIEVQNVSTSDGYILQLHRIPSSPKFKSNERKRAVLLQHGLLDSSAGWVLLGPENGLDKLFCIS